VCICGLILTFNTSKSGPLSLFGLDLLQNSWVCALSRPEVLLIALLILFVSGYNHGTTEAKIVL